MRAGISDYRLNKTKTCWEKDCKGKVVVVESRITGGRLNDGVEYWGYCKYHWQEMCEIRGPDAKRITKLFTRRK